MSAPDVQVEDLMQRPWSRQVVADEDGVYVASIPELKGCFAAGPTPGDALNALEQILPEWFEVALESRTPIPPPKRITPDEYSGRFSVRVPRSLHRALSEYADEEDSSLNQLVATLLSRAMANVPGNERGRSVDMDAREQITADALTHGRDSIGAAKGIAGYLREKGAFNLSCLIYSLAASRIADAEGAAAASKELGTTAALARRHDRFLIAESLWRESIRKDRTNLRSSSSLGQLLHHQGRYDEAVEYLEPASSVDNYALLFLGWSLYAQGNESDDGGLEQRGLQSVENALERWAYQNSEPNQRGSWLRHLRRLVAIGPSARQRVVRLADFANSHSGWDEIEVDELWESTVREYEPGAAHWSA